MTALFEIDTRPWLSRLSMEAGRPVTLADVPDPVLDDIARQGFDWVWLMGVWQTGAAGRAVSRGTPSWRAEFEAALPDLTDDDICGSPYAIQAYEVDTVLGGPTALLALRRRLAARGLRLMLDFVPNHTAPDHAWVHSHPEFYVQGSEAALAAQPDSYLKVGAHILARGRDPNFPAWPDTLQLNYANPALQDARIVELKAIAGQCDGLRCDMAMLLLPDIFQRTWGVAPPPFWRKAIDTVRQVHAGFTFLAEAYWDLEWELQQQGFDYCYDKRLYDRLHHADAGAIRGHLHAGLDYQEGLARFLENHDEPRAAATFPWPQHQAAAIVTFFAPGLRFFHQGEREGARVRLPVHLCRGPVEPLNAEIAAFYDRLLSCLTGEGAWSLIAPQAAWNGNPTWQDFIAYGWSTSDGGKLVVVVNYCDHQAQCRLRLPFADLAGRQFRLTDVMGSEIYERDGDEMAGPGLFIDLGPWRYNVFRLEFVSA